MKIKFKIILSIIFSIIVVIMGVGLGSVNVPPSHIISVILNKIFSAPLPSDIEGTTAISIIWKLRLPRTLLAFLVGGAVAVSGSVMQSVLKNPLAKLVLKYKVAAKLILSESVNYQPLKNLKALPPSLIFQLIYPAIATETMEQAIIVKIYLMLWQYILQVQLLIHLVHH